MDRILNGQDIAKEHGFADYRTWMKNAWTLNKSIPRWNGRIAQGPPIRAMVERGRWIAMCDCNGAVWVDPEDPIAFCHTCGNAQTGGAARPVIFPGNWKAIENELLKRPMIELGIGISDVSKVLQAKPKLPMLGREWRPGETLGDLKKQHKAAKEYAKIKAGGAP